MAIKFTNSELARLLKILPERDTQYTDVTGLSILHRPSKKGARVFFLYRGRYNNQRISKMLGSFPEMTVEEARNKWSECRVKQRNNQPLVEENKPILKYAAHTFGAVWKEWRALKDVGLAQNSVLKYTSMWNTHLHNIEEVDIAELTPAYVMAFLKPYLEKREYDTARRLSAAICACVDYAVFKQILSVNPLLSMSKYLPKPEKGHYATFADDTMERDMVELFNKMSNASPNIKVLLYMYFYTLLRSVELRRLRFSDIVGNVATVKTKTLKEFKVPLSIQAMECIEYMRKNHRSHYNDFVFEGMAEDGIISDNTLNKELTNRGYKDKLRVHGIRACGRQWLQTLPYAKESIIEQCLSHVVGSRTVQAYNRGTYLQERAKLMQEWSDFVRKCIGVNAEFMFK